MKRSRNGRERNFLKMLNVESKRAQERKLNIAAKPCVYKEAVIIIEILYINDKAHRLE